MVGITLVTSHVSGSSLAPETMLGIWVISRKCSVSELEGTRAPRGDAVTVLSELLSLWQMPMVRVPWPQGTALAGAGGSGRWGMRHCGVWWTQQSRTFLLPTNFSSLPPPSPVALSPAKSVHKP